MQDFLSFMDSILDIVCEFLISDPIVYFVGLFIMLFLVGIIRRFLTLK